LGKQILTPLVLVRILRQMLEKSRASVDNSLAPGIGHRLDDWANQDLTVSAIVNLT